MKTQLCQPNQKWICLLVSDLKKLWGLSHLVVIWIRMWGPACEPWFMCRFWSQQLVSWASTRTLLRKTAPSPTLHPQRDMHLDLSSCPFYAHCNIYNFTQYCWMKVVLLQLTKTLYRKYKKKARALFKGCNQMHPPINVTLIAVPWFLEFYQRSRLLGSPVLYFWRLWEKCKYYSLFIIKNTVMSICMCIWPTLFQGLHELCPTELSYLFLPHSALAHSAPSFKAFLFIGQTKFALPQDICTYYYFCLKHSLHDCLIPFYRSQPNCRLLSEAFPYCHPEVALFTEVFSVTLFCIAFVALTTVSQWF